MTKKELTKEQLDNVSGGTVTEFEELMDCIYPGEEMCRPIWRGVSHLPAANSALAATLEKDLLQFGIRANISTGFAGTGLCSKENMYQDTHTGAALTHSQVIARLRGR